MKERIEREGAGYERVVKLTFCSNRRLIAGLFSYFLRFVLSSLAEEKRCAVSSRESKPVRWRIICCHDVSP